MLGSQENSSVTTPYAIRSGGHTLFAGAVNTNGGVTIDLRAMDAVNVNPNHTITTVGAGSIWKNVYEKLQSMNLAVLGARVAGLGVGGVITGGLSKILDVWSPRLSIELGGISFFSPEKGFACDNVVNMEVVLANSEIVNANAHEIRTSSWR